MALKKITKTNIVKANTQHPDYKARIKEWTRVRDCMKGEEAVKDKRETYLPRPAGMSGEYEEAYDGYIERAHFPLICPYALSGALGVIITKMPEFNLPPQLEYLKKDASIDGRSLSQLFMDVVIENFETGRVPLIVNVAGGNTFKFIQYKAEQFINWKTAVSESVKSLTVAVLQEQESLDVTGFSHQTANRYNTLSLTNGVYNIKVYDDEKLVQGSLHVPSYMGRTLDEIPLIIAGSINNSVDIQPIPLISVANCSIQIYRKQADLANSEFLSCNPTLVIVGATDKDNLPNVVGSSVMMVIPNEAARVFYTTTDTDALTHVNNHIKDLYEEAIRHGVAILDNRKGVEAAEALRIRQATQSASIYSIYLSSLNAIISGLKIICKWQGLDPDLVSVDAPSSLTFGVPDSSVLKELITGFAESGVVPINVVHKYLVASGLLDQTIGFEDYLKLVEENIEYRKKLGLTNNESEEETVEPIEEFDEDGNPIKRKKIKKSTPSMSLQLSEKSKKETSGAEDKPK